MTYTLLGCNSLDRADRSAVARASRGRGFTGEICEQ